MPLVNPHLVSAAAQAELSVEEGEVENAAVGLRQLDCRAAKGAGESDEARACS